MEIKEFLKFDWRKIILTLVLLVVGFASSIINIFNSCSGGVCSSYSIKYYILQTLAYLLFFPTFLAFNIPNLLENKLWGLIIGIILLILNIVYLYILSCLILNIKIKKQ